MSMDTGLTPGEADVLALLQRAWDHFVDLPVEHPQDQHEFCQAIHDAQARIMMRPTRRIINRNG